MSVHNKICPVTFKIWDCKPNQFPCKACHSFKSSGTYCNKSLVRQSFKGCETVIYLVRPSVAHWRTSCIGRQRPGRWSCRQHHTPGPLSGRTPQSCGSRACWSSQPGRTPCSSLRQRFPPTTALRSCYRTPQPVKGSQADRALHTTNHKHLRGTFKTATRPKLQVEKIDLTGIQLRTPYINFLHASKLTTTCK